MVEGNLLANLTFNFILCQANAVPLPDWSYVLDAPVGSAHIIWVKGHDKAPYQCNYIVRKQPEKVV